MVTAKAQSDDIVTALDLGANDYLTKPIDFPVAVARIGTSVVAQTSAGSIEGSEERYALGGSWLKRWPLGLESFEPTLCIFPLVGRPCWAMKKEKSGTDLENGLTGSMTRIENESKTRLPPSKGIDSSFRE